MFQQCGYKPKKYLRTLLRYYFLNLSGYLKLGITILFNFYIINRDFYLGFLLLFFCLGILLLRKVQVLKLKFTKRMIRLITVILLSNIFILFNYKLFVVELYLIPLIIIICNFIILPIERFIKRKYIKKAKEKLKFINPLVFGITGSFGKTTVKYFLYQLLSDNYSACMSRKSYNTTMGLCKSILEDLKYGDEIYIAELGACYKGDIHELVKFVEPSIGVITDIGIQHIESFKSIDNVLKTKLEILKSKNIHTLIINNDNLYLKNFDYPKNLKVIRVGQNEQSDVLIKNIITSFSETEFDIIYHNKFHIKTNILGMHNVMNLTLAFVLSCLCDVDQSELIRKMNNIYMPNNRLEFKKVANHTIIDNSFNSNVVGFKNNIDLLNKSKDYKVLITPGVVELNKFSKQEHKLLAEYIINKIDMVYLIENKNTLYMKDEFDKHNFINYYICDSFKQAFDLAINNKIQSTILIENDLTDYYMNGGI